MKKLVLLLFAAILVTACQPAATPQPTSSPVESRAGSIDDLVGVWWFPKVGMIEFKVDGTSRITFKNEVVAEGNFVFDNKKVTWSTSASCESATYEAYVTKQDGKPISLRMQVVGSDPCRDRANAFSTIGKFQNP